MSILESWEVVRRDKKTGEEKVFPSDVDWNICYKTDKDRRKILSTEEYEIFVRKCYD